MYVIGLTGGIASGKSTAAAMLRTAGACILDADAMTHELLEPGNELFQLYVDHFGAAVVGPDGTLNRRAIAEIVFREEAERHWIDNAAHPVLRREMLVRMRKFREQGMRLIFLDVPLLFETGWDDLCDEIWVVYIPAELQRLRLTERDGLTPEQAEARIAAQLGMEEKRLRADVVLDNSGTIEQFRQQVMELYAVRWNEKSNQ